MSQDFESKDLTAGQLNAIVKKLGGHENALRLLRGELMVTQAERKWREEDGVICFTVISDGTTGPEWIRRLESTAYQVSRCARELLASPDFTPTKQGTVHEVRVLRGARDATLTTRNTRAEAEHRGLATPHAEVAPLIRVNFTDNDLEAMGLWWIVTMHEPIKESSGDASLLGVHRNGASWLYVRDGDMGLKWSHFGGFAFVTA